MDTDTHRSGSGTRQSFDPGPNLDPSPNRNPDPVSSSGVGSGVTSRIRSREPRTLSRSLRSLLGIWVFGYFVIGDFGAMAANPRLLGTARLNQASYLGAPLAETGTPTAHQFASASVSSVARIAVLSPPPPPANTPVLGFNSGGASAHFKAVQGAEARPETLLVANENGEFVEQQLFRKVSYGRVPRPFPLRLIVHQGTDANAPLVLLQRIYVGLRQEGTNEYAAVLTTQEAALDSQQLSSARRISSAHLPWSTGNDHWEITGTLAPGEKLTATVTLNHDDHVTNPFLHTYHPDHDNLNAEFNAALGRGHESYHVERRLTFRLTPAGDDFDSLTRGATQLGGVFEESLIFTGKNNETKQYDVRGAFVLNRISELEQLITD